MIFDIGGRQTALAIGLKPERVEGRTSGSRAEKAAERGAGRSQKDPGTYATAYDAYSEIANFKKQSGSAKVALRGNPRGVSSNHVLFWAFGCRRVYVRHAAFLYLRQAWWALVKSGAKNGIYDNRKDTL